MTGCIVGWAHTPFGKFDAETVESLGVKVATEALALSTPPRHLVVVGAGYIGLEMAEALVKRGLTVSMLDIADQVMNIALDFRLIDPRTLEVVDVISYQKQIIGREISAGVFDFLNGNVFDISAGEGGLEPVQLAVGAQIAARVDGLFRDDRLAAARAPAHAAGERRHQVDDARHPLGGRGPHGIQRDAHTCA